MTELDRLARQGEVMPQGRPSRELRRQNERIIATIQHAQSAGQIASAEINGVAFAAHTGMIASAQLAMSAEQMKRINPEAAAEIDVWRQGFQMVGLQVLMQMGR